MTKLPVGAVLLLVVLAPALGVEGRGESAEFLPLADAKPGVRGVARTVFQGDEIEEFPLEIIGRYENFAGPGQDIVLARLLGDRTAYTGVVSGMSGSPVYVEGRLLGALSYRIGSFTKEPIAGITPIGQMMRAGEFPAQGSPRARLEGTTFGTGGDSLVPIETPLLMGGFARDVVAGWTDRLRLLGLDPVQAGVESAPDTSPRPLSPGSPIAAVLVRGDMSIAATGTLTYVDGVRLYAFGHPFLQTGAVEIPAARATILWTLSSWLGSSKIAQIGETVGTIREDRLTAIVGDLGPAPTMIPVTVEVDAVGAPRQRRRFEVARVKSIVPTLVEISVANSLSSSLEYSENATLFMTAEIEIPGHAPVRLDEALAGDAASPATTEAAHRLGQTARRIYENPFEEPAIDAVTVRVKEIPQLVATQIDRIVVPEEEIRPGQPFDVRAHLLGYRGEPSVSTVSVVLPTDTAPGPAILLVGEGREVDAASFGASAESRLSEAHDARTWLDRISERPRGGRLYFRLLRPTPGASLRSTPLPDLPPSILALLAARKGGSRPSGIGGALLWEEIHDLAGPVRGLRSVPVRIGRREN